VVLPAPATEAKIWRMRGKKNILNKKLFIVFNIPK
jgi:hypothetical protein